MADSLVRLCELNAGKSLEGVRAYNIYRKGTKDLIGSALAKSPYQAASAVCDIYRVSDKELTRAAFEAMGAKRMTADELSGAE